MKYTRQQKLSAVRILVTGQMSYRDAAKSAGVTPCVVYYFIYHNLRKADPELYKKSRLQLRENVKRWKGEQAYELRPMD